MRTPYNPRMRAKVILTDGRALILVGRQAQALIALYEAGPAGTNAAEVSNWALCFTQYVKKLRDLGFEIITVMKPFDGGRYGQYVLKTPLRSLNVLKPTPPPKRTKPATAATVQASNSISTDHNYGDQNYGTQ